MDVAAASGVSYATVSRYLNGNPHVSAKAAERIAAAVKQVNYTPNNAARSLVRQRTQTVAFVVHGQPDSLIADPNISTILLNANQTLGNADYQLITLISVSPAAGARIARLASSGFADGWILNTFHKDDPLFQGFANISVPVAISGVGYGSATPSPPSTSTTDSLHASSPSICWGAGIGESPISSDRRTCRRRRHAPAADHRAPANGRIRRQLVHPSAWPDRGPAVPAHGVPAHRGLGQIGAQRTVLNNICAHFSTPEAHMEYALITAMSPFAMM